MVKHYLTGKMKGKTEVFANTPGMIDNVKPSGDDRFIVSVPLYLDGTINDPFFFTLLKYPLVSRYLRMYNTFVYAVPKDPCFFSDT